MRRFPDVIKLDFVADSEDGKLRKHRFRARGKPVKHPKSQMFAPVSGSRIAAGFEDRLQPQKEEYICAPFRYDIVLIRQEEWIGTLPIASRENSIRTTRGAIADSGPNRSRIM
ncbi:hypothetical protein EAG_06422 [Camponotus floridanus]|uniref:Uncharacterized protein n=1 Tax=Camponotus floridanus TaxID=104421 RepID=E1ZY81_CAMFO|nr:hypothetical protein EAG_06422 [Camponotus floridanus]